MNPQVEQYLQSLPFERGDILLKLRETIFKVYPEIEENFDSNMPTYLLNGQTLCTMASKKNYVSFYIIPYDLLTKFSSQLNNYNTGKSCIRYTELNLGDLALLRHMLMHCGDNFWQSKYYGKMNSKK